GCFRHISIMFFVPPTLTSISFWLKSGLVVTILAQWITTELSPSGMVKNLSRESTSHRSPSEISTSFGTYFTDLSPGRTRALTWSPRSKSSSHTWLPKNPAAPVTKYTVFPIEKDLTFLSRFHFHLI